MIIEMLRGEFENEILSTRKLLQAIPESALDYKPAEQSWTTGELALHIATVYHWYVGTLTQDVYNMAADHIERPAATDLEGILDFFERNITEARRALEATTDESLGQMWSMTNGDQTVLGPVPRGIVSRGFLFNHIYHHRGEMIVYLRATGNKVPSIYGPTYEQSHAMTAGSN